MNLSIVTTYKSDGGLRDKHLAWTVSRYKKMFKNVEIIISEDKTSRKGSWQDFCKSKYINLGVMKAKNDNILITDIDVVLDKQAIVRGIKQLDKYCCILPYNVLYKLNYGTSERVLNESPKIELPKVNLDKQMKVIITQNKPQGIHLIRKSDFIKVGGYDERFIGWGSEDAVFQIACRTILEKEIGYMPYNSYHFKHPIMENRQEERDKRIGELLEKYKNALNNKDEMQKIIAER
jgi:predicted glycosyltransferase involved in capsule biosynthesis